MKTILAIIAIISFLTPNGLACFYNSNETIDDAGMSVKTDTYDELPIMTEQNWHKKRLTPKQGRFPSSVTPEEEQFMKKGFYYLDPKTGRTCLQIGDESDCELGPSKKN